MALLLLIAGCATVGRSFDTTHVRDVKAGQDKEQVRAWFGEPTQTTSFTANERGCVERWTFTHAHAVVGGSRHAQVLVVDFDPRGTVCDTAYSEVNQ